MSARVTVHPRRRARSPLLAPPVVVQRFQPSEHKPVALCWAPSGDFLAIAVQHGVILLYYVLPDKQCELLTTPIRRYTGHSADVLHMCFSRSNFLLSASMDRCVRLWHTDTPLCLRRFVHPDMVTAVSFHPANDNFVISGGCDGVVRLWRPVDHACVSQIDVRSVITVARFDAAGNHAFLGCYDGTICVLDVTNVTAPPSPRMRALRQRAVSADAADAADAATSSAPPTRAPSGALRVRRRMSVMATRRRRRPGQKVVALAPLSPLTDATRLLALCGDGRLHVVHDGERGVSRVRKGVRKERGAQIGGSVSHDGRWMVLDGVRDGVRVLDVAAVASGRAVRVETLRVRAEHAPPACCAAFATERAVRRGAFDDDGGGGVVLVVGDDAGGVSVVWCGYA